MTKIYRQLVESFGYIAEAPINATGYDPDQVQYAYQGGKANPNYPGAQNTPGPDTSSYTDPRGTDNVTNDPVKDQNKPVDQNQPKKKTGRGANAGTRAFQHWLNSKGIKVAVDGKWGPETAGGNDKYFNTYVVGKKISKEQQDEYEAMRGVGTAHNVRVTPGSGNMYIGSPEYIAAMNKYGFDVKTGDPIGGAKTGPAPGEAPHPAGLPPELNQADKKEPYWVKGTRYEFLSGRGGPAKWTITHRPGEFAFNGETRTAANLGYTGPQSGIRQGIAQLDREKNLAAQAKESTELDIIRKLSGM